MRNVFRAAVSCCVAIALSGAAAASAVGQSTPGAGAFVERAGVPTEDGENLAGVGLILAIIGALVVTAVILIVSDDDEEEPVSP